jgi:hypothetical protein
MRKLASAVLLIVGALIALGAYGHGFVGRLHVDAELSKYPIGTNVYTMLYVVWYFVSGCMLLSGAALIWSWFQLRRGRRHVLFIPYVIGALYVAAGVGGMIYRNGDVFMSTFIIQGLLVVLASAVLGSGPTRTGAPA